MVKSKFTFFKVSKVCVNRKINGPNQLWEFDIKQGVIHGENRVFYFLAFIDVFLREIVGYHIGLSCPEKNAYVEAFFSLYEVEFLQTRYFRTFREVVEETMDFYHKRRFMILCFIYPLLNLRKCIKKAIFRTFRCLFRGYYEHCGSQICPHLGVDADWR